MDLENIQKTIGYYFKDSRLLMQALTHRSYLNEKDKEYDVKHHNERFEFLGDAVLELVVTEYLFTNINEPEGYLTALRAAMVNYKTIGMVGNKLGLENQILLSQGEKAELGKARLTIVADAMEALLGAMYIDGGTEPCVNFIKENILVKLPEIIADQSYKDSKTNLQEFTQKHLKITPNYKLISSEGPDHNKVFRISVLLDKRELGVGEGKSKQDAETEAAAKALGKLQEEIEEVE